MNEITSLGRPLDPGYPTNRAVLLLMPAAGILAGGLALARGTALTGALLEAVLGALAALLSWAIAREVAPDDEHVGAFLALGLGYTAFVLLDAALLPAVVALAAARLVARTTGQPATTLDATLVVLLGWFAAWQFDSPLLAWVVAAAFALDALLRPSFARQWVFAGLAAGGGAVMWLSGAAADLTPAQPDLLARLAVSAIGVAVLALAANTRHVYATGDAGEESLSHVRVRAAQIIALLTGVAAAAGTGSVEAGGIVWACLAAVSLSAAIASVSPSARAGHGT